MPIDIQHLRDATEDGLKRVRESEAKRFADPTLIDRIIQLDREWVAASKEVTTKRTEKNKVNKEVGQKKKKKENADDLVAKSKALSVEIEALEVKAQELRAQVDKELPKIGNFVHESVPVSQDEEKDNEVIATFGECKSGKEFRSHAQLLWMIDGYEPERGVATAGHRAYFLKGPGVLLNQALINYALQFLVKKGYTALQPPYFMNKEVMAGVAQLSQFDEELYHVKGETGDEKYLIATSEQPICAYHRGEWLGKKDLPLKYVGVSTCFRKEAGKHGKDTWGIFRVHQFDKIEQFCITSPEDSWKVHDDMKNISEEYLQSLGLPYRVVNIVSGELNLAAAKKYDIEAWFPGYEEYKELVSCSNCLDYQARAMEIRFGSKKAGEKTEFAHMLNSTLCALTRTICCILENYQTPEGVKVPDVLVPFMGGMDFLPFVRAEKENTNSLKMVRAAAKKKGQAKDKALKAAAAPPGVPEEAVQKVIAEHNNDLASAVAAQGEVVRKLKAEKAAKDAIKKEVDMLLALKNFKI